MEGRKLQLLKEWCPLDMTAQKIKESREANGGKIVLKGILQRADTLNQNGRVYPKPILEREIRNYQKFIRERRSLGEADHPDTSVIELKNVSHIVTEATMSGDTVHGVVELLDTPSGKILQSLVESGITLGISSRGVGSTHREGDHVVVQDDFQLICFDIVSEPSTSSAFLVRESAREITAQEIKTTFTRSDRIDRLMNDIIYRNNLIKQK